MYPIRPVVKFQPSSRNPCSDFHLPTKHRFDAWCPSFWMTFVMHRIFTSFCRTYRVSLQANPTKFEKHAFYVETLRRKNAHWFKNRSIEFEVVRLDRFCFPIALSILAENLLEGQFLEPDGNPKVVFTCSGQMLWPWPGKWTKVKPFSSESWLFIATRFHYKMVT